MPRSTSNHRLSAVLLGLSICAALVALLIPGGTVAAAPPPRFSVNSTGDAHGAPPLDDGVCATAYSSGTPNGVCTLRAAIEEANHVSGGGAVVDFGGVTPPATYLLEFGQLTISAPMTIVGAGSSNTIIDGNGEASHQRVIQSSSAPVLIEGVTIQGGKNMDLNAWGGGIVGWYDLTLRDVTVRGNSVGPSNAYGGGVFANAGLTVINSRITGNRADSAIGGRGGGLFAAGGGPVTLLHSTVDGNSTSGNGGGISGSVMVSESTISNNTASNGGGISGASISLLSSTVSGNNATSDGGGIYHTSSSSTVELFNVTINGNTANSDGSGVGHGGGIANASGNVNFRNTILAGNLYVYEANGFQYLGYEDCYGVVTSQGYNIVGATTDCTVNGTYSRGNPSLGPLRNNGGPTDTQALGSGSAAIDAGQSGGCTDSLGAPIKSDQRGARRSVDGNGDHTARCDIGAFEYRSPYRLDQSDRHIQYNGWRGVSDSTASGGGFRISNVKDDTAALKFRGTSVDWHTRKGPLMGKAQVLIDGVSKGVVDLHAPNTQEVTRTYGGLTNAAHTIAIKVLHKTGTLGYDVAVDGFVVGGTLVDEASCAVTFDTWSCSASPAATAGAWRVSTKLGAIVRFQFTGTSIDWLTATGSRYGRARVCVDGNCSTVNLFNGATARTFSNLGAGEHVIQISPLGTRDPRSSANTIVVDGFGGPIRVLR